MFLLTGSLGAIVLAGPIAVPGAVMSYHLPALALTVLLAIGMLARGRLRRIEGARAHRRLRRLRGGGDDV